MIKKIGTFSLTLLVLGCGSTASNYSSYQKPATNQIKTESVIVKPKNVKVSLTVTSNPKNARVRILNIGPKYQDGILLKKGKYHIEVSSKGFETYKKWIEISENKELNVSLKKIVDNSKSDIAFLEATSEGIPALPLTSLKSENLRNYLICSLQSPEKYIEEKLKRLKRDFENKKFDNNFEHRRAKVEHENLLKQEISQAAKFCDKKITAPVFYTDAYLPVMDEVSENGKHAWISTWYEAIIEGKRYYSSRVSMGSGGKMYIKPVPDLVLDNYQAYCGSCKNFSINLSVQKLEELFTTLPKYTGTRSKYKKGRELKGRVYLSMKQFDIFTLYPEYYEFGDFKGKYISWKPWRREGIPYEKRSQYVIKN